MTAEPRFTDHDIIERYTDQPSRLAEALRRAVIGTSGANVIVAYALADLDQQLAFAQSWLVLSTSEVVLAEQRPNGAYSFARTPRSAIAKVELSTGLSCHVLRAYGAASGGDARPLLELRFTHRQRRSMEGMAFLLEQITKGIALEPTDPDQNYLASVAQPIKDAQALVSTQRLAVVWRLLSYLKPYKSRVIGGMSAATLVTLLALVPPFLTGHLVDRVIRPVQSGELKAADVVHVAWLAVLGIAVVQAVSKLCIWLRLRLLAVVGELVARDLRDELFAHLQRLSISFYSRKKTGSLRISNRARRLAARDTGRRPVDRGRRR